MKKYLFLIVIWCLMIVGLFQRLQNDWWFEDDPSLYHLAASVENPLDFFIDKNTINLMAKNELAPMLLLSFWIDDKLAPKSASFAYFHQAVVFILVAILLFIILNKIFKKSWQALLTLFVWTLLPSTITVNEYLSTRCYMEGLLFAEVTVLLSWYLPKARGLRYLLTIAGIFLTAWISLICKEFFPTALLFYLACFFLYKRNPSGLLITAALAASYFFYRIWAVGISGTYGMELLSPSKYLAFLSKYPIFFAGNDYGYLIFCFFAVLTVLTIRKKPTPKTLLLIGTLLVSLATIYPISYAIMQHAHIRGPWMRSGFILNTVLLVLLMQLFFSTRKASTSFVMVLVTTLIIWRGGRATGRSWDRIKRQYQAEGLFLINGPNGLLYSKLPAGWFLPAILKLYPDAKNKQFVSNLDELRAHEEIATYSSIWTYRDRRIVEEPSRNRL